MNSRSGMLLKHSRIALAQIGSVLGDLKRNVERQLEYCEKAIGLRANGIIFPELSLTGYTLRDLNFECAISRNDPLLDPIKKISRKISIVAGGVERDERGAVYNTGWLFEDGEIVHAHRKVYPPTYGLFEEGRYFTAGKEAAAFSSERLGRVGLLVCEDLWHPALPYIEAMNGAQMLITIAASPTRLDTGEEAHTRSEPENYTINREHHAAYARLLGMFVVFVNRVGVEDGVNFWGGSEVVAPSGETIARGKFFEEDLIVTDIDPDLVRQARQYSRHFLDDNPLLVQQWLSKITGVEVKAIEE